MDGVAHEGYGVFVEGGHGDANDEVSHYNWMIGLMKHAAKIEGFSLDLIYSAFEPNMAMRTVIFRVYPANLDALEQRRLKSETKTFTGAGCVRDFYSTYIHEEDLRAHSGLLFREYLVPVFSEAATELLKADYTLIADMWSQIAAQCGVISVPQSQNPMKPKKGRKGKRGKNVS